MDIFYVAPHGGGKITDEEEMTRLVETLVAAAGKSADASSRATSP